MLLRSDTKMELLDLAVINGVVEKRGAWFYFGEDKFHGMKSLVEAADDDLMEQIHEALNHTALITDDGEAIAS